MPEYKIEKKKIIFNADFKASVDFFPKQYEMMKALNSDYPNWEVSGLSFVMQNKENNCSATLSHKKIICEFDQTSNRVEESKQNIIKTLQIYNKFLPISSFNRIGVRFFMFVPMQEIKKEELADIIFSKLFAVNKDIKGMFAEKVNDLAYIIDYDKDGFYYHLKCGPMPNEHVPAWVDFGEGKHRFKSPKDFKDYLESFPAMSIFIDMDCYKADVLFTDMETFLKKSFDNCAQNTSMLKKYILGE